MFTFQKISTTWVEEFENLQFCIQSKLFFYDASFREVVKKKKKRNGNFHFSVWTTHPPKEWKKKIGAVPGAEPGNNQWQAFSFIFFRNGKWPLRRPTHPLEMEFSIPFFFFFLTISLIKKKIQKNWKKKFEFLFSRIIRWNLFFYLYSFSLIV